MYTYNKLKESLRGFRLKLSRLIFPVRLSSSISRFYARISNFFKRFGPEERASPEERGKTDVPPLNIDVFQQYLEFYKWIRRRYATLGEGIKFEDTFKHFRLGVNQNKMFVLTGTIKSPVIYTPEEEEKIGLMIIEHAERAIKQQPDKAMGFLDRGFGWSVARPFFKLCRSQKGLALRGKYEQIIFSFERKNSIVSKDDSATIIQRAFRKYKGQKTKRIEPLNEALRQSMLAHKVPQSPEAPPSTAALNKDEVEAWLAALIDPKLQKMMKKLIKDFVFHRSHQKFMRNLIHLATEFNDYLGSLPLDEKEYVMVVPDEGLKSNHWVSGLIMPHLKYKPKAILYPSEVEDYLASHPEVKRSLFVDDALYSGRQMQGIIDASHTKYILLLPYHTANVDWLARGAEACFLGECMASPAARERASGNDIHWTYDDSMLLNSNTKKYDWGPLSSKTGVYFSHKVADSASVFLKELSQLNQEKADLLPKRFNKAVSGIYGKLKP